MGNSASNISSVVAPAAKTNDPYVTQSYVDTNFLTNGNFTTYDNYMKGVISNIPTAIDDTVNTNIQNSLTNYTTTTLPDTLRNSTLYCPPDQTYCSLSNTKAGIDSIVALNGNVGIGTINPNQALHINRTTTQAYSKYTNNNAPIGLDVGITGTTGDAIIFHRDNKPIRIATNDVERMRVTNTGNVGIGTTNPAEKLDVSGNINASGNITNSGSLITSGNIGIGTTSPSSTLHINRSTAADTLTKYTNSNALTGLDVGVDTNGNGIISHRNNKPVSLSTNNIERIRVSEGGGVGIGTTNTSALLTVNATNSDPGSSSIGINGIRLVDSAGTRLQSGINTGYSYLQTHQGTSLSLNPVGNNVGIGTTSPNQALHINRTTTPAYSKYTNTSTANLDATTPGGLDVGVAVDGNGIIYHRNNKPIQFATNNTERMRVSEGGNVGIGTTNPIHRLDIAGATRSGTHAATSLPVYITGDISDSSNGIEIRQSNGTQGIGFGFKSIYAAGSNNDQDLNIMPKGVGRVGIGTTNPTQRLDVSGNINASGNITNSGSLITSGNIGIGVTNPSERLSIGPLTSTTDVIAMSLPNNWYIKMKGATTTNPAGQLCFSNGSTATTSIDYVCIDPTKTT